MAEAAAPLGAHEPQQEDPVEEVPAPSANDEYLLYQVLLGTFPVAGAGASAGSYSERIEAYMIKAVREAKVHTSWVSPNEQYEAAIVAFVRALLAPSPRNLFLKDLRTQACTFAWFGALNSLSMTLLKLTSPGVPDVYQGNETSDLSLVDPDNRRAVDYAQRARMLDELESLADDPASSAEALAGSALDGRAKMWIVARALELRRSNPDLFTHGQYVPLQVQGQRAGHVVAFMRRHAGTTAVTIAGRLWMKLGAYAGGPPLGDQTVGGYASTPLPCQGAWSTC